MSQSATPVCYTYPPERVQQSQMMAFAREMVHRGHLRVADWQHLYAWSLDQPEAFWTELQCFCQVDWREPFAQAMVCHAAPAAAMLHTQWFVEGKLNFAQNLLACRGSRPAIENWDEKGGVESISWDRLTEMVAALQGFLRGAGVQPGDVVAGIVDNSYHPIAMMLATTSIGAIWTSCASEFGTDAIVSRLLQVQPKVILAHAQTSYNGKVYDCVPKVLHLVEMLATQPQVLWVGGSCPQGEGASDWHTVLTRYAQHPLEFVAVSADHPLYILFSSGTTGQPKCIVHRTAGTLVQHKKELQLHCDIRAQDKLFYFTTCGWMMWNWQVSALSLGATVVTYQGSVSYPGLDCFWSWVCERGVTVFGGSPKLVSASAAVDFALPEVHGVQTVLLTGAPALEVHFQWLQAQLGKQVAICSISGGTDIVSCFLLGNPLLDIYPGTLQAPGLGMAVEVWGPQGEPQPRGCSGELVCSQPFVTQPLGFLADPEGERYLDAYYAGYTGKTVWQHGDEVVQCAHGSYMILGRSDATLNPGGVRMGSAELYQVMEAHPQVCDALVVGVPRAGDCEVLAFVMADAGAEDFSALQQELRQQLKKSLSPRHVPQQIFQVEQIPYTLSGKKMELLVRDIFMAKDVSHYSALANPEDVAYYQQLAAAYLCDS
ncbi:MAG: acetoacetate--CoA ligase [Zetaproteobacteria bacterium]|nr:acetoacetate--CoA ligase [Zetaproteobacteria bacterium]